MQTTFSDTLQNYASKHRQIEEKTLQELYYKHFPEKNEITFFWDLQSWKEEKLLQNLGNNHYKIRRFFTPLLSDLVLEIHQNLEENYDLEQYCFSESIWYNQFSRHQSPQNLHIIEFEKEICESVFYHLKDEGYQDIFLLLQKEDNAVLERYAFEAENPIIIQKIISKAPVQTKKFKENGIKIPYLEKILIDLFVDEHLRIAYKGAEQKTIIENILSDYVIDFKKLFAYAQRRRKEQDLKKYLFENFAEEINRLIV